MFTFYWFISRFVQDYLYMYVGGLGLWWLYEVFLGLCCWGVELQLIRIPSLMFVI